MAEGNHDGPPMRGGMRGRGRGRGGGMMRGDRDDTGRIHRGEVRKFGNILINFTPLYVY